MLGPSISCWSQVSGKWPLRTCLSWSNRVVSGAEPIGGLRLMSNYRIVHLRQLESTVVGMRRSGLVKSLVFGATSEEKGGGGTQEVGGRVLGSGAKAGLPKLVKESLAEASIYIGRLGGRWSGSTGTTRHMIKNLWCTVCRRWK
ncbi:scp-like extracellular protein [Striga asiatica]|uniref:Scp-like extracellular protein n=1 Tax=Striga asiatica TaxID=4170 RepID=A0A5A7Q905_STRAF|nr:scp-like extracellular protein [Striga asiatica]